MKRTIVLLLFAIPIFSCKKDNLDPCDTVTCLNGGTCETGTCNCINGYSGPNCETPPDPCAGIACLNGGVCANGVCNCPEGFTGGDCSLQVTPEMIEVLRVSITDFPQAQSNGASWDNLPASGPDIFIRLSFNGNVLYESGRYTDCISSEDYVYDIPASENIFLENPTSNYTITIYDYDGIFEPSQMASISFTPYSSNNRFPQVWKLDASNCNGCQFDATFWFKYHF